jgi:hypothetical protein
LDQEEVACGRIALVRTPISDGKGQSRCGASGAGRLRGRVLLCPLEARMRCRMESSRCMGRCWAGLGDGGCCGGAARPGVHIVLGIHVGTLLNEALNRSYLVTAHPGVEQSCPLCTGGGQWYEDQERNDRQESSGGAGRRRNLYCHMGKRGCIGGAGAQAPVAFLGYGIASGEMEGLRG